VGRRSRSATHRDTVTTPLVAKRVRGRLRRVGVLARVVWRRVAHRVVERAAEVTAQERPDEVVDLRGTIARVLDAWVLPHQAAIPDSHAQFADGEVIDPDLRARVETLGAELVRYAGVAAYPAATDGEATPATGD